MKSPLLHPFSKQSLVMLVASASILASHVSAIEYDLTSPGAQSLNVVGAYGGTAIVTDYWEQPTGTGVFNPFLSLQTPNGNTNTEQAYNTDGFTNLFMDSTRPNWNSRVKVGDLGTVTIGNASYFAFVLDSNEPGGDKSLISVDNIRLYTSATDNTTSVGNDVSQLDNLGTLRWAMNTPTEISTTTDIYGTGKHKDEIVGTETSTDFNKENWIKLDSAQENQNNNSNGGSGMGDMAIFIPVSAFTGVAMSDYLWFYNLNGAHYSSDSDLASQSGFEEWRVYTDVRPPPPPPPPPPRVPDSSATLILLGMGLGLVVLATRRSKKASTN
jgi:hypothetical protein